MNDTLSIVVIEDGSPVIYSFYGGLDRADARSNLNLGTEDQVTFLSVQAQQFRATGVGFVVGEGEEINYGFFGDGTTKAKSIQLTEPTPFVLEVVPTVAGSWAAGSAGASLAAALAAMGLIIDTTTP